MLASLCRPLSQLQASGITLKASYHHIILNVHKPRRQAASNSHNRKDSQVLLVEHAWKLPIFISIGSQLTKIPAGSIHHMSSRDIDYHNIPPNIKAIMQQFRKDFGPTLLCIFHFRGLLEISNSFLSSPRIQKSNNIAFQIRRSDTMPISVKTLLTSTIE